MNLDQKKQAKMQWLQNPNQSNLHNLDNITDVSGRKRSNI